MTSTLRSGLSAFCLACLVNTAFAADSAPAIRDDAGLFRAHTVDRAQDRIADIRRKFERKLFVQTVASVDPHQRRLLGWRLPWFSKSRQAVNRMLEEQARKIADEAGVSGIYVVISVDPRDVHVIVRPEDDPLFSRRDADTLRHSVARSLSEGNPDPALLTLVDQVHATLLTHAAGVPSRSALSGFTAAGMLGGGFGLWLALCLIRYKMRARAGIPAEENTAEQARRTPALLGALFGCPAGLPIYDKLHPCPPGGAGPLCEPEPLLLQEQHEETEVEPLPEQAEDAPLSPG